MPSHNGAQVTLLEAPTETGHGTIKIVDFGLAKTQSLGPPTSDVGTPRYKAPEIERGALGDAEPFSLVFNDGGGCVQATAGA